MSALPRTAISLYVAVALHVLLVLAIALGRPSQESAGPGQGLSVRVASLSPVQRQLLGESAPIESVSAPAAVSATSPVAARRLAPAPGRAKADAPARQAPKPSAPEMPAHTGGGGRDHYFARLRAHLAGFRRALQPGLPPARSLLRVAITRDGWIEGLALVESSGIAALDAEAMDIVRRAAPLPAPPGARAVRLIVPVEIVPGG